MKQSEATPLGDSVTLRDKMLPWRWVEAFVIGLALALVLYLPIEPLRLMPDALVALAAGLAIVVPGPKRMLGVGLILLLGVAAALIIGLDMIRGFGPGDTINALRVLLRYAVMGAALYAVVRDPSPLLRRLAAAIVISAAIQFFAAAVEFIVELGKTISSAISSGSFSTSNLLGVDGTTGRYDRLGYLMVAALLILICKAITAMVLLAIAPGLARRERLWRLGFAVFVLLLVVGLPIHSQGGSENGDSTTPTPNEPGDHPSRGSTALSLDPNKNFRLYLTLRLLPWAAFQEPATRPAHTSPRPRPRS